MPRQGVTVRTVDSIGAIDAAAWNRIAGANPLHGHGWLLLAEREGPLPLERRYVLLERAGRLLAAAVCYVDAGKSGAESVDDLLFGRLAGAWPGRLLSVRPALVCGLPWSLSSGCLFASDLAEPDCGELADRLVAVVTAMAQERGRTAVFLGVAASESRLMAQLRHCGYRGARHEPLYLMELAWPDFESYRRSLPSRSVRQNIRREMNRNRKQGVTIRALNEPVAQAGCLHAIVDRHFRRYGWQAFPYGPGWFGSVKSALGDDAVLAVALQHGQPVGVALQLRQQGTRQLILVCVDHAGEGGNFTHFNLAYYWAVEDCIRAGDRRYVVGPGQHDSRTRRGYRPRESFVFCRPPGRVRRRFIGAWLRLLEARLRRKA